MWRPIIAKIATLEEIEKHWSLIDLADAHDALDLQDEMEREAAQKGRER